MDCESLFDDSLDSPDRGAVLRHEHNDRAPAGARHEVGEAVEVA